MGVFSEQVASIDDGSKRVVTVPEWKGLQIEVRSLTLAQRNQIALTTRDKKGNTIVGRYYAAMVIAACFDPESGEKAFSASDMDMLQQKNGAATDRLARVAMELSGLGQDADDDEDDEDGDALDKAIEESGKDSSSTEASGSDSY